MTKLVFLDTETTGLDRDRHEVWDIGLILRDPDFSTVDIEYSWLTRPHLCTADPNALRIGRFYERMGKRLVHADPGYSWWRDGAIDLSDFTTARSIAAEIAVMLDGAIIVGAVPDFDQAMLGRFLRKHDQALTANYHLVDVETLAAGALQVPPPWYFDELLGRYGLRYDEADRHTAIGDARMARDLYDAVMGVRPTLDDAGTGDEPSDYTHPRDFIRAAELSLGRSARIVPDGFTESSGLSA